MAFWNTTQNTWRSQETLGPSPAVVSLPADSWRVVLRACFAGTGASLSPPATLTAGVWLHPDWGGCADFTSGRLDGQKDRRCTKPDYITSAGRDWNPSTELISTALLCIKWHIWKLQKERLYQEGISLVFIKMLPQSYWYAMYLIVSNTNKKTKHFRVKLTSTLFSPSCQSQNKQYKTARKVSKCNSEILLTNRKTKN